MNNALQEQTRPTNERRFVLLFHQVGPRSARPNHWDLMIEDGDALATWAFDDDPLAMSDQQVERLSAHRRHYLDYEGPVSGERGAVTRRLSGYCVIEQAEQADWRIRFRETDWDCELILQRQSEASWSARFVGRKSDAGK